MIGKNCQILSNSGRNCQILLNILSSVVKSCETLSNEKNGDLLSIIPCDFNDGRVSHVDQEVGEGYLPTDESRGWKVQIQIQKTNTTNTNTTMQSEIPPPLWQQHPCLPPPLEAWQWSMSMSYVICIVGCPNQKIIANRKNLMYTSICEHQLWVSVPGQLKQHVPQTVHCLPQDASLEIGGKICFQTMIWIPWRFLKPR